MNIFLVLAMFLTVIAFFLHTFIGDKELRMLEPKDHERDENFLRREKWTMSRCGWHLVSYDLFFAAVGLVLITFTHWLNHETFLLKILSVYFLGYGFAWLIGIILSKKFPYNYLKLGQWLLLWVIGVLTYCGSG